MYESYWGLQEKPFENTPDPRFLFHTGDSDATFARLLYTLKSKRGAAMFSEPSGSGKTFFTRALLQKFDEAQTEVALLNQPCANGAEFLYFFASLDQFIASRGRLRPFEAEETSRYITHRLDTAGRREAIFDDEGLAGDGA